MAAYETFAAKISQRLTAGDRETAADRAKALSLRSELDHARHSAWLHAFGKRPLPSVARGQGRRQRSVTAPATLGDILYADGNHSLVLEEDWVTLVRCSAAGDQGALHGLYDRTHMLVFALAVRITNSRETAEGVTLDVFDDLWRLSPTYDKSAGSVLAWVMSLARSRAIGRLGLDPRKNPVGPDADVTADVVPPSTLRARLAKRIAQETRSTRQRWAERDWNEVAAGISCKLLATDMQNDRVSMLVRLMPGVEYPPHRHAGVEELHLLHGELWIDERKLYPGDYHRAEPGSSDDRVWSETGCTCVLMTSTRDELR